MGGFGIRWCRGKERHPFYKNVRGPYVDSTARSTIHEAKLVYEATNLIGRFSPDFLNELQTGSNGPSLSSVELPLI